MISSTKSFKSPRLFLGNLLFLLTTFIIINQVKAQEEQEKEQEPEQEQVKACSEGISNDNYDLGLHVGALFIILFTSSFGKNL
jgi:hypothetical protein